MSRTQFFAMREDLLPVFADVEEKVAIRYALAGRFLEPSFLTYSSGAEIPNLSLAIYGSAIACNFYLVYGAATTLKLDKVIEKDRHGKPGGTSYHLNQLLNPDTIVFSPGGLWKGEILLYGEVATVPHVTDSAKERLRYFQRAIRKHFQRIGHYWVGADAFEMLKAGKRLTIGEGSPKSMDLILPQ